jgi:hypothetical protein
VVRHHVAYNVSDLAPFAQLFPLGMLNIAVLATITVLIVAEKSRPLGHRIGQPARLTLPTSGAEASSPDGRRQNGAARVDTELQTPDHASRGLGTVYRPPDANGGLRVGH